MTGRGLAFGMRAAAAALVREALAPALIVECAGGAAPSIGVVPIWAVNGGTAGNRQDTRRDTLPGRPHEQHEQEAADLHRDAAGKGRFRDRGGRRGMLVAALRPGARVIVDGSQVGLHERRRCPHLRVRPAQGGEVCRPASSSAGSPALHGTAFSSAASRAARDRRNGGGGRGEARERNHRLPPGKACTRAALRVNYTSGLSDVSMSWDEARRRCCDSSGRRSGFDNLELAARCRATYRHCPRPGCWLGGLYRDARRRSLDGGAATTTTDALAVRRDRPHAHHHRELSPAADRSTVRRR